MVEVESIINSRPFKYVSSCDLEEPLTPLHLINGRRVVNLPDDLGYCVDLEDADFTVDQGQVRRRVRYTNLVFNHFWRRWHRKYLAELKGAHCKYNQQCTRVSCISVGIVVVVHEESLPRGFWKLGLVEELFRGRDGVARAALVKLASRDGKGPSYAGLLIVNTH